MATAFPQTADLYQNFRFAVADTNNFIQTDSFAAGFNACTLPEHNIDAMEYAEGTWTYSRWQPGRSAFGTITLTKGVASTYGQFGKWVKDCAEGWNYRTDIIIHHLHRADVSGSPKMRLVKSSRIITCKNCMPVRFKPGTDLDATGNDMAIEEIEFHLESFSIAQGNPGG